jgi:DNA-binding response OmpR family regulator
MEQHKAVIHIIDDSPIGAEIRAIFEGKSRYRAILIARPFPDATQGDGSPDLIIPFLAAPHAKSVKLLEALRQKNPDTPLLPVLTLHRPEDLHEILDELSPWVTDFVLTPLRTAEVLFRVRRMLTWPPPSESSEP